MMATTSPDTFLLQSFASTYDQPFFVERAEPAIPSIALDGKSLFDLRSNSPGDQTIPINVGTRIRIDRLASYQFAFIAPTSEGSLVFESFDSNGDSLGETGVPYDYSSAEDASYRLVNATGVIGPSGRMLPANADTIEVLSVHGLGTQFGFLEDQVHSFVSSRSLDRQSSSNPLHVDTALPLTIFYEYLRNTPLNTPKLHSLGFESLDADGQLIEGVHVERFASAADTRLTQTLNPGDTSFFVQSATGWSNRFPDSRTRALAWYGYRDSRGTLYPDYTYTRNVARDSIDGLWDIGAIEGNRITLRKPWSGPTIPAGTAVRNAVDSDSLIPALANARNLAPTGSATISGVWQSGQRRDSQFPPGTASVRLASLMNQSYILGDETVTVQMRFGNAAGFSFGSPADHRRIVDLDVLANDSFSSAVEIRSATNGVRGTVSIVAGVGQERSKLRYTSPQYFIGTDFFSYTLYDPSTGQESTERVFLQSLGGNLDQNAALQESIRVNAQVPKSLQGEISITGYAVKNERFNPEEAEIARYPVGRDPNNTYVTLHRLVVQSGSLNLLPNGKFDFEPMTDFVGSFRIVLGYHNGSDKRLGIGDIEVFGNHFLRDQRRLAAIGNAENAHGSTFRQLFYPPNAPLDANNKPFLSWRVYALPYMGYSELYGRFRLDEAWNGPNNLPLLSEMPNIYRSSNDSRSVTSTRYLAIANSTFPSNTRLFLNNANSQGNSLSLAQVTDGLSNTILVVQAATEKAIPWTRPDDLEFNGADPLASLGSVGNYFNAVFGDGKVRALPTDMGGSTFQSLATISAGDFLRDPGSLTRAAKLRADFPGDPVVLDDNYQSSAMKQLMLAMHNHESAYKQFSPPGPVSTTKNLNWRVYLLPFLEQGTLFSQFRLDEPWDSPTNMALSEKMPDIFRSLGDSPTSTLTRFRVLGGANMAYGSPTSLNQGPRLNSFTDGLSNSLLIVEAGNDKAVPWTKPDVLPVADANIWNSLGQFSKAFMLAGMADGSVVRIPTNTPPTIVRGLATINLADSGRTEFNLATGDIRSIPINQLSNNLRQIGLAVSNFENAYKRFPNDFLRFPTQIAPDSVGLSWRVAILPYLEENTLFNRFHLDEPWDSPNNLSLLPLMPSFFKTGTDEPFSSTTRVQRFQGRNTIDPKQRMTLSSITDGTSNTIFAALSAAEKAVPWTKPADMEFGDTSGWEALGNNVLHTIVAFADTGVRTIDRSVGNAFLNGFAIRNDGRVNDGNNTNVDPARTMIVREGGAIDAITVSGELPVVIDIENPFLAFASVKSDGYNRGMGASLRVSVQAFDNAAVDGKRQTKLNIRTRSNPNDPDSPLTLLYSIDVIVLDDDGVSIKRTSSNRFVVVEGGSGDLWLQLGSQPTGNVTLTATASDATELAIPNRSLVFTPANWNVPQRIVVQGVIEPVLDGEIDSEIQIAVSSTTDSAYADAPPLIVPTTTYDNRPASIELLDPIVSLSEDVVTTNKIPIGQLQFNDDGIGFNRVTLAGRDADWFVLGTDSIALTLYLRAGVLLDFETKNRLEVSVWVDDTAVFGNPDAMFSYALLLTDVNEPPLLADFQNTVTSVRENSSIAPFVVAKIVVQDDALGVNTISVTGADAQYFRVNGTNLEFHPIGTLDYERQSSYSVNVVVGDNSIAGSIPSSKSFQLSLVNVPEIVSVTDQSGNALTNSIRNVRIVWDTLVFADVDSVRFFKSDVGMAVPTAVTTREQSSRSISDLLFSGDYLSDGELIAGDYQLVINGNGVRNQVTQVPAGDSQSNKYRVTPKLPPKQLSLAQRGIAKANAPVEIAVSVIGADTTSRFTYRLDSNSDGVFDREYVDAPSPFVIADLVFDHSGVKTVKVVAETQNVLHAIGELVIPISSWRGGSANDWLSGLDTNRDGDVSPLDVLTIINHINTNVGSTGPYDVSLDIDRDSSISPLDVLTVVNHLNLDAPETLHFKSLRMSNTGEVEGFTSETSIDGELTDPASGLYFSMDGGLRKNASNFVLPNGTFELTDAAIRELFGDLPDGEHILSAFVRNGTQYSIARDRRFYLHTKPPGAPEIVVAMQFNSGTFLQWTQPSKDLTYDVFSAPVGGPPLKVQSRKSTDSTELTLVPGEYDVYVDAVSSSGLRMRSKGTRVRIVQ